MHVGLLSALFATVLSVAETQRFADADYNGRVFDLSGRVVYLPGQQSIILDDGTGRTVVYGLSEELAQSLTPGSRVTVRVQTIVNDNGKNCLWCRGLAVHAPGDGQVTVDDDVRAADIFQGRHDLRFVRFDGILTDFHEDEIEAGNLILFLYADGEIVPVYTDLREPLRSRRNELLGSTLRVTGLVMPSAGGWRTFQGRMIAVCGAASRIDVRPPSPIDPFDAPRLEKLHHLDPREIAHLPQLSAAGRVAALGRDGVFFVQTGNRRHGKTIAAALAEGEPLPPIGEDVRLVGFPETDLFNISLRSVRWRAEPLSEALPVNEPVAVTAGELFSDANGRPRIGANLHGRLVTIQGLVRALPTAPADTLRLACDGSDIVIDARPLGPAAETLTLGSRVALTGLCILETDVWAPNRPFPKVRGLSILPRSPADVVVLAHPPWWTSGRLFALAAALLSLIAVGVLYIRTLNRDISHQNLLLTKEQRAHVEAELRIDERTRLAIELHDALSQTLTGVAFQIDAAEKARQKAPAQVGRFLAVARQTLSSCREELRNCLWDLHNDVLETVDTEEAIRSTIDPHTSEADVTLDFKVPRAQLSDTTFHAVLRIVRELVVNALRHGAAKRLAIRGRLGDERLDFSVSDDGCGFDPASRPSVAEGHFGLHGIAERLARLGGRMSIRSAPGQGTTVTITLENGITT